jgi:hypothetical protein
MKQGKKRSLSICVSDIPKERILKHENGKMYMNIETWDYDEPDKYDNDFSISMSRNKDESERIKNGEKIDRVFIGNGKVWEQKELEPITEKDKDDLPF